MWTWIKQFFGIGECKHEWREFEDRKRLLRVCDHCLRFEKFEPDVGGWTSGHWDEVK
jgi:hypothetical protein